ncbi:AraC family transcriptional regulator [Solimonas variicoloris]|uniref:AraC family transcriptional regulator n=1 Tax=Solimonas variicoloris TaxID=254408 RepID=UPI000372E303|nr:AraC family transcriptional regulator [Solimonas variicoloris]
MSVWDFKRSTASVQLLVAFGRERGHAEAELLRGSGLSPAQLADPNVEIAAVRELRVIANLLRLSGDAPGLGLSAGLRYHFTAYGFWGYGLVSSATAADALRLALRFLPLTYAFTQISFHEQQGLGILRFDAPDCAENLKRFVVERDVAAAATLLHELAGPSFTLRRMALREAPPRAGTAREASMRLFGIEPVYGAASNHLAFDRADLARPLPGANPVTAAMCEQLCSELVQRRRAAISTAEAVRLYLQAPATRLPDLDGMARQLNVSTRTLKRRLHSEGTSFRLLLEDCRRALADELLRDRRLRLGAVAERLGFADLSSFSQAYKRWHGVPPSTRRATAAARRPAR